MAELDVVAGTMAKVTRKKDNGDEVTLVAGSWRVNLTSNPKKIPNFRQGRKVAAPLADADFSSDVIWYRTDPPIDDDSMGLRLGARITIKAYVDENLAWEGPFMVAT